MRKNPGLAGSIFLTIVGLALSVFSLAEIYRHDGSLRNGQRIQFADRAGVVLKGAHYPGSEPYGVVLAEGFGSDQVAMRALASEFAGRGFHVLTFDFSGHGRSPGGLGFDNARTDTQAWQALAAKEELMRLSGLPADQIVMVGHSLGARVILQASLFDPDPVAGLILIGAQVNLTTNTQAEVFTGTSDADLEWVRSLGPQNPAVPIHLISGEWDDILTPEAAALLYERLGGESAGRKYSLRPGLVHNYEIYDPAVAELALSTSGDWLGWEAGDAGLANPLRAYLWATAVIGIVLFLLGSAIWSRRLEGKVAPGQIEIARLGRFLWAKVWLWLAALPLLAVIFGLVFVLPFPFPAFNLIYVGFLGAYGLLLWWLYRRGRMPGVHGKLPFSMRDPVVWWRALSALAFFALVLALATAFARSGWFDAPPAGLRMLWLLIFAPVTALGFWIGLHESELLRRHTDRRWPRVAATLIGLLPFFLWTGFLLAIGSLSGLIGGLQGLLTLAITLMTGTVVQNLGRQAWLTATLQAILLYWLILPQGVLFL